MDELDAAIDARHGPIDVAQGFLPGARGHASRGLPRSGVRGPGDVGPRKWPGRRAPREPMTECLWGAPVCYEGAGYHSTSRIAYAKAAGMHTGCSAAAAGPVARWDSRAGFP